MIVVQIKDSVVLHIDDFPIQFVSSGNKSNSATRTRQVNCPSESLLEDRLKLKSGSHFRT